MVNSKKNQTDNAAHTNATKVKANFQNTIYYQIEDTSTILFYENIGVPVRTIEFPGKPAHLYALIEAKNKAEADTMNRVLSNMHKEESLAMKKIRDHELSFDQLIENGYDPVTDDTNPLEIMMTLAVTTAPTEEIEKRSKEK